MGTIKKQYFGIKFPLTANNINGFFVDLNSDLTNKVVSEIAHVIMTPKRTRLRRPEFGTDLMKYIFEPNDSMTWGDVQREATENVKRYVKNVDLTDVSILEDPENPHSIFLDLQYTITKGNKKENNRTVIKII